MEEAASLDEEVHRLAPDHQEVGACQGEEAVELASQAWEEVVGHASWEEVEASQDAAHTEEVAFGNAQEEQSQALIQEETVQGEVGLLEASEVAPLEVKILESADLVAASQAHLGKSSQEPRTEELEQVVERSEAASCPVQDHQHHEWDQLIQAEHEQEVQLGYPVRQLGQDPDPTQQQHS